MIDHKASSDPSTPSIENSAYQRLNFLYKSVPLILLINLFGTLFFSIIQWQIVDSYSIIVWLSVAIIVLMFRYYHYKIFQHSKEEDLKSSLDLWRHRYYTYVLISGAVWGSTALLFFTPDNMAYQMVVILFIVGLTPTAIGIISAQWYLVIAYALVSFAPLITRFVMLNTSDNLTLAYIISALALLFIFAGKYFNAVIETFFKQQNEISETKHSLEAIKSRFFSLFENAPVGIFYYDRDLNILESNHKMLQIIGTDEQSNQININNDTLKDLRIYKTLQRVFEAEQGSYSGNYHSPFSDKELFIELQSVPLQGAEGSVDGGIGILRDLTLEVEAKEEIRQNAFYDPLTKLPNRTLLIDRLSMAIEQSKRIHFLNALLFIDIDHFKHINDSMGHQVGDKFLQEVAKRLIANMRSKDTVARLGGDEFVVLLNNLSRNREEAMEEALSVAKKLHDVLNIPFSIEKFEINTGASMGVYIFSEEENSVDDIIKNADTAMYFAKENGRNRVDFYEVELDRGMKKFMEIEKDLHHAIKNDEFELYYQPQAVLSSNKVNRLEALIRWNHPSKGLIMPDDFIHVAEKSGLIHQIGEWVIRESAQQIRQWQERNDEFPVECIAINVSSIQFAQPLFVQNLLSIFEEYDVRPECFELELTESIVVKNIEDAIEKIELLKKHGVTVALDDFGTGYSSFSYLQQLPVSVIKIDRSFISNLQKDPNNEMIVRTIIDIAKNFNLHIVAEGVETQEEYDFLSELDFDHYQGFFCEKAMPPKELEAFITTKSA